MNKVAVIGLGYVGLPLCMLADKKGYKVTGIDIDSSKITALRNAKSDLEDVLVINHLGAAEIDFTCDFNKLSGVDVAIICVPTPVDKKKMPDLTLLKNAVTKTVQALKPGSLLVIESTINPGVCDEVLIPLIENRSDHVVGATLDLAHCPERINPGDSKWNVENISRVVGANSSRALKRAVKFYKHLINADVKEMGSIKEAEAVKVVENSFRDINIAFVNELAMSFQKLGINVENVIDGAATKPFAFMPHHPGCGVGGHCIPVDPYYLIEYARGYGFEHSFLSLARNINERMPSYVVGLLEESVKNIGKNLVGLKVSMLGLSYKANVGDLRESPALAIKQLLLEAGVDIKISDPYINDSELVGVSDALKHVDVVLVATGHKDFLSITPSMYKKHGIYGVIDGRNIYKGWTTEFKGLGITYSGVGV